MRRTIFKLVLLAITAAGLSACDQEIDRDEVYRQLENSCEAGIGNECMALARLELGRAEASIDHSLVASAYARGCVAGDDEQCELLDGMVYLNLIPREEENAYLLVLAEQCAERSLSVCGNIYFYIIHHIPDNADELYAVARQGCDEGHGDYCATIASTTYFQTYEPLNDVEAFELFERACDLNSGMGCAGLANMQRQGWGAGAGLDAARVSAARSCDLAYGAGCYIQGLFLDVGMGTESDQTRAAELFQEACDLGFGYSCFHLGNTFRYASSDAEVDPHRAAELYLMGCRLGDGPSCENVPYLSSEEFEEAVSDREIVSFFEEMCQDGPVIGCAYLGAMYLDGTGVAQNTNQGLEHLTHACDYRVYKGCIALSRVYFGGHVVARDTDLASEYLDRACALRPRDQRCQAHTEE